MSKQTKQYPVILTIDVSCLSARKLSDIVSCYVDVREQYTQCNYYNYPYEQATNLLEYVFCTHDNYDPEKCREYNNKCFDNYEEELRLLGKELGFKYVVLVDEDNCDFNQVLLTNDPSVEKVVDVINDIIDELWDTGILCEDDEDKIYNIISQELERRIST